MYDIYLRTFASYINNTIIDLFQKKSNEPVTKPSLKRVYLLYITLTLYVYTYTFLYSCRLILCVHVQRLLMIINDF